MTPFELMRPRSLRDALLLLDPDDPDVRPFAGGTALMLMMKAGLLKPRRLVSLRDVEAEYSRIAADSRELHIGSLARLSDLEHSSVVRAAAPVICDAMPRLSNVRVRNVATVGGSLAHGDPHMDLPPVLCALGARVSIAAAGGERSLPVEELITGYMDTALRRAELITRVTVPLQAGRRAAYLKCTARSADDWPALGVAVRMDVDDGVVSGCSVFLSAATDRPTRARQAETELLGHPAGEPSAARRAGEAAAAETALAGDSFASAEYKRQLVRVYVARAVAVACAGSHT